MMDNIFRMIKEEIKKVLNGEVALDPKYSLDLYRKLGMTFNEKTVFVPISFNSETGFVSIQDGKDPILAVVKRMFLRSVLNRPVSC